MDHDAFVHEDEVTALLENGQNTAISHVRVDVLEEEDLVAEHVLPIALFAALAMASTAATSFFAYATLLCHDPQHCHGGETSRFAGFTAIATGAANIFGISAFGFLQKLVITNRKLGLLLWMLYRSMSAVMLLIGVSANNIYIALSGRIFEGLASDNLLHFTLNSVYAQCLEAKASSFISYSLALYMIGISVSPFAAGLFKNFTTSFFIALGLFGFSIAYLQLCVRSRILKHKHNDIVSGSGPLESLEHVQAQYHIPWKRWWNTFLVPLEIFRSHPWHLSVGLCLFFYNTVQSYIFNALLVYTSVRFHFNSKENGFIISIAHSVAALYILVSLVVAPRISQYFRSGEITQESRTPPKARNAILALISLAVQSLSLTALAFARQTWHIYCITVLLAIGLPTPSFVKAYFAALHEGENKVKALAALAMMETFGGVLGPLVLGSVQSSSLADGTAFYVAAALGFVSMFSLIINLFVSR